MSECPSLLKVTVSQELLAILFHESNPPGPLINLAKMILLKDSFLRRYRNFKFENSTTSSVSVHSLR